MDSRDRARLSGGPWGAFAFWVKSFNVARVDSQERQKLAGLADAELQMISFCLRCSLCIKKKPSEDTFPDIITWMDTTENLLFRRSTHAADYVHQKVIFFTF